MKEGNAHSCLVLAFSVQIWLVVDCTGFCYGPHCQKQKHRCENLGVVHSSDVDGIQSHKELLDCKMPVSSYTT